MRLAVITIIILLSFTLCITTVYGATTDGLDANWASTNTKYVSLSGSSTIDVTITNLGSAIASMHLTIESGNSKLAVTPLEMTAVSLEPNVPQTVYFSATNLGVENQVDNIPITIKAYDTYTFSVISEETVYATLLPTLPTQEPTVVPTNTPLFQQSVNVIDWTWIVIALIIVVAIITLVLILRKKQTIKN